MCQESRCHTGRIREMLNTMRRTSWCTWAGILAGLTLTLGCAASSTPAETPAQPIDSLDTAPPVAADDGGKVATDEVQVVGEEVTYEVEGKPFKGYIAYTPSVTAPRPGVLVVHEWWGHNEYARQRARQLAAMGYTALALDMYGEGKQAQHPDEAQGFSKAVFADLDAAERRFRAAYDVLAAHQSTDPQAISAIGYCFGGGIVLNMARRGVDLDGVASFHGSLAAATPAQAGTVKAKVLVLTGEKDPMVPPEQVEAFRKEMAQAQVSTEIHTYPDAVHAFTNPNATELGQKYDMPIAYDSEADAQSWLELSQFLAELYPEQP